MAENDDNWLARLKKRPSVAALLLIASVGTAVLAWSVSTAENIGKLLKIVGLDSSSQTERKKLLLNAYIFGQELSNVSYFQELQRRKNNQPLPSDLAAKYASHFAEAATRANLLGINTDLKSVNLEPLPGLPLDTAQGVSSLKGLIAQTKDSNSATAFKIGFDQNMYWWKAIRRDLEPISDLNTIGTEVADFLDGSRIGFPKFEPPRKGNVETDDPILFRLALEKFDDAVRHSLEK
jgi:hypothetical protein